MLTLVKSFKAFVLSLLLSSTAAMGQVSISGGTGGETLCVGSGYVQLTPIVINEGNTGDFTIQNGVVDTLNLAFTNPAFEFEPNVGSFAFSGGGSSGVMLTGVVTATKISVRITESNGINAGSINSITISGLRVRAIAGAPPSNYIQRSSSDREFAINGLATGSNLTTAAVASYTTPVISAGSDELHCEGQIFHFDTQSLSASIVKDPNTTTDITWTGGAGSWVDETTLAPEYTPGAGETGVLTLTLSASNSNGSCGVVTDVMELDIQENPEITADPVSQVVCEGSDVTFSVSATGTGLTYQWQKGGTDIAGATSSTLTLSDVDASHAGSYTVIVRGVCDATGVTSAAATLTVNENPEILMSPSSSTICENSGASFTVDAGITTGMTYQWQVSTNGGVTYGNVTDDDEHNNVTSATLNLVNVPLNFNNRLYRVVVGGTCSPSVTSDAAQLTVQQNPVITIGPAPQVVCEGSDVTFSVSATGTGLTYQWQKGGFDIVGATSSTLTLSDVDASHAGSYTVIVRGTCDATGVTSAAATLTVEEAPEITSPPAGQTTCEGGSASFTVNAGPTTTPTYQWQESEDGVTYNNIANGGIYSGARSSTLDLTTIPLGQDGYFYRVQVGSSGECSSTASSDAGILTVQQNPVITMGPASRVVCEGSDVTFSVLATGTGLTYQLQKGGSDIVGATSSTLTLSDVDASHAGSYTVIVRGTCDATGVTSAAATLTVEEAPEITSPPAEQTTCEGGSASFTVNAGPTTAPTYQWQESEDGVTYNNIANGGIYSGAQSSTLDLTTIPLGQDGYFYRVQVGSSGECSSTVSSDAGILTVQQNPVITIGPASRVVCEGSDVTFNVSATGTGLTYQWQKGGFDIAGATSSTLTLSDVDASHAGSYTVIVRGTCDATGVTSAAATLTVEEAPEITSPPAGQTTCEGGSASFTVNAGLTTAPTYQWQESEDGVTYNNIANGGIYSGAQSSTLDLTTIPLGQDGYFYRVQVGSSGECSSTVSSNAGILTVLQNPVITIGPAPQVVCEGSDVTFSVSATGTGLTYQWQKGGSDIVGATSSTLTLSDVDASHAGSYTVIVRGTCDATGVTSAAATLTVEEAPEITSPPAEQTTCEGGSARFTVNAGLTTAPTYQWQESEDGVTYNNIANGGIYSGAQSSTLDLTTIPLGHDGYFYRVQVGSAGECSSTVSSDAGILTVQQNPVITIGPAPQVVCEGSDVTFSVSATGTGLTYQWQKGGSDIAGATSSTLTLSDVDASHAGSYTVIVRGTCDATGITSAAATLTVNENPEILTSPSSSTICENSGVSFTVDAGITTGVTYQWQVSTNGGVTYGNVTDDGAHNDVTSSTLNLVNVPISFNNRLYRVVVGGTCSPSVTSDAAQLTVQQNPVITTDPASQVVCEGSDVTFIVSATGTGLTYQWQKGGTDIAGATSSTLTLSDVDGSHAGSYTVIVRGVCDATGVTSAAATLTVNENPEVLTSPLSSTICENSGVSFTVDAGITTGVTYQWQVSTNGGVTYGNVTDDDEHNDVTSATLNLVNVPLNFNNRLYRVVVGGTCSPSVTSDAAQLTVQQNPVITMGPASQVVCEGSDVTFIVSATGTGLTYQWQKGGSDIVGATSSTLTLSDVDASHAGSYTVIVRGTCDATGVTSAAATLTVEEAPEITSPPAEQTTCEGGSASFTVNAGLTTTPTYQWQESEDGVTYNNIANGGIYSGAQSSTLDLTTIPLGQDGYFYRVQVGSSGECSSTVSSNAGILTVQQNPVITIGPAPQVVCEGSDVTFSVSATGTSLTYQWQKGGTDIAGATSSTLTLSDVDASHAGSYTVIVRGTCDATGVTSAAATLTVEEAPEITSPPTGQTTCEGGSARFTVNAGLTTAPTYQWQESEDGVTYNNIANGGIYSGAQSSTLDLTTIPLGQDGYFYRVQVGSSGECSSTVSSNAGILTVQQNPVITIGPAPQVVCEGSDVTFIVSATGTGLTYQWQKGGTDIAGATSSTLTLSDVDASHAGSYTVIVQGVCDATGVTSAAATLTVNENPEILMSPSSSTICENSGASFTVDAGITTGMTYQWQVSTNGGVTYGNVTDDDEHNNVTSETLNLVNVPLSFNNRLYRVVVGGTCSPSVTSDAAQLTVQQNPVILVDPASQVVCEGSNVTFSVLAAGTDLTYQWQKGGSNIAGATSSTLTLSGVDASHAGSYTVIVRGVCDATGVTSAAATLTVNENPEILTSPSSSTICENSGVSFTVNAGITTGVTYQWQVSTNGGVTYGNVTDDDEHNNVTSATLNLVNVPLSFNNRLYRVVVGGTCSPSVTSDAAQLTVQQFPVVSLAPAAATICETQSVTFSVTASGTGLTYQWQENNTHIPGATASILTLSNVLSTYNGNNYRVIITGACGTVTTDNATLTVNRIPDATASNQNICSGATTAVSISNPNAVPGTTFTWTVQSFSNVTGATNGTGTMIAQSLTTPAPSTVGTVTYNIVPQAAGCTGSGYAVTVNVQPIPDVAAPPQTICSGSSTNVPITNPNGVPGTTFNWTVLGTTNVSGASNGSGTSITQALTAIDRINDGIVTYRITPVAGGCSGSYLDVDVRVSPRPVITNGSSEMSHAICSAATLNFTPTSSINGTTYTWTSTVAGTLSGVSAGGAGAINDTPVNGTNNDEVVIYSITPSYGGCAGQSVNYVVTVRPVPAAFANDEEICSGNSTSLAIHNPNAVPGTTFTWTVSTTNVSGASNGNGSAITQVLTATDALTNGTAVYHITPWVNGCAGVPYDATVTVKPVPVITNSAATLSQQICSGQSLNFLPTSSISGTIYSWTSISSSEISSGVSASGSAHIVDAPVNNTSQAGTVTYRITPVFNGCAGIPVNYVVTIKPLPSASVADVTICSGQRALLNISPAPQNIPGTVFSWVATPSANVTGWADGDGSTIDQVLSTTDATVGSVVYTITPAVNGCNGAVLAATVTVNPVASVDAGIDYSVCEQGSILLSSTIGGSATSGIWSVASIASGTLSGSTTSGIDVEATYTIGASDIGQTLLFRLTSNDPDNGGPCMAAMDEVAITINESARVTLPADYTVCEPSLIGLTGTLSGSATSALWSTVIGDGTLSSSSVTGTNVNANYAPVLSDVTNTLRFRLTTNDPDGFGPCPAASAEMNIHINESAKVSAGADIEVCEDQVVTLNGAYSGSTSTVIWDKGAGTGTLSNDSDPLASYTLSSTDISNGSLTFTLITDDPDGAGPCTTVNDAVNITIHRLPEVALTGLKGAYAENDPVEFLGGFPTSGGVGVFTGPGITAGTNEFNPDNANIGVNTITYTFTSSVTSCTNSDSKTTIVSAVTDIDFVVGAEGRKNSMGDLLICQNSGDQMFIGDPGINSPEAKNAYFTSPDPYITGRIIKTDEYYLKTDGIAPGTYVVQYVFTNNDDATQVLTKNVIISAGPQPAITVDHTCLDEDLTFTHATTIPDDASGEITRYYWVFDEFGETRSVENPVYAYKTSGEKSVTLEVETDRGCVNRTTKIVRVGIKPNVDFNWEKICSGLETTEFEDLSYTDGFSTITSYQWDFGDGSPVLPPGQPTDPFPDGGTYQRPHHAYESFHVYDVTLTVSTNDGCVASKTDNVYILDYTIPGPSNGYFTDFEAGSESWVPLPFESVGNSSWIFGLPSGNEINSAASGNNAWWTGKHTDIEGHHGTYFRNEVSEVIGPCLNIMDLKRPMISLDYWSDTQAGFDGVVLQYSTDGAKTWETIGDAAGRGINWYNARDLSSSPGGQDNFAWSGSTSGWRNAKFNLEQIDPAKRNLVVFRVAFTSNNDNPKTGRVLEGFAFDNVYIGEKTRNVLIEHFTNSTVPASTTANSYFNEMHQDQITERDTADFVMLQYHMRNPAIDPLNLDNPADPFARSQWYGVSSPPTSLMDGIQGDYYGKAFTGDYTAITPEELDRRSLEDPLFSINLSYASTAEDVLQGNVGFTYIGAQQYTNPVMLHLALVEDGVDGNTNVLRKLLWEPQGKVINEVWEKGQTRSEDFDFNMNINVLDPDNLYVIAFVQDKSTKKILQTIISKAPRKVGVVVGVPDDPVVASLKDIRVYPNPASSTINIGSDDVLPRDYAWKITDQRGVSVLEGELNRDLRQPQPVDISRLANGIYFLSIQMQGRAVFYRKIAIMNRN